MTTLLVLAIVSLGAATVTGALGYGYSSITVPLALLMIASRALNPALVVIEVAVNVYLVILNRRAIRRVIRRVAPVVAGVLPGVLVGSLLLAALASGTVKLVCYAALLPLILAQAAGVRRPLRRERAAALPFGLGVGLLYALTTISGPPLALFLNNQGLSRQDFKLALAVIRFTESVFALAVYAWLGLLTTGSAHLAGWLLPGVLVGMPLGHVLIGRIAPETFRRVCMSFDAWLVAFGLSRVLVGFGVPPAAAYQVLALTFAIDAILLRRFFVARQRTATAPAS
jgi:uncharacterized membrane protein YfcA